MVIKKVMVAGTGNMGRQLALLAAMSGYMTYCYDVNEDGLKAARDFAEAWLAKRVEKGKMTDEAMGFALENLTYTTDLRTAAEDADLVMEAVPDIVDIKKKALAEIDEYTPEDCIYASNSSYIVSSRFCDAVKDPSKVLNVHFFNPALVQKTVEVVRGPHVSDETFETAFTFAESLGKMPVRIEKEIYGFCVNRIFSALTREACYLVDMGIATPEDIDKAVKGALGHAMGPLETLDMTGIDLEYNVYMEKFRNSGKKEDLPAACLTEHFSKGEYGRKTGKGFYDYSE